jgi:hypothetical protein
MGKKILTTATMALVAATILTACTGANAEEEFLVAVRGSLDTGFSDSELLGVARDACNAVANGGGEQALQQLIMSSGLAPYEYGVIAGHGVTYLCPDQAEAFDTIVNG